MCRSSPATASHRQSEPAYNKQGIATVRQVTALPYSARSTCEFSYLSFPLKQRYDELCIRMKLHF